MTEPQENILKFIGDQAIIPEEVLLKVGFTRQDIMALRKSGYIRRTDDIPISYLGQWAVYLKQKGIDYLSELLKEHN